MISLFRSMGKSSDGLRTYSGRNKWKCRETCSSVICKALRPRELIFKEKCGKIGGSITVYLLSDAVTEYYLAFFKIAICTD